MKITKWLTPLSIATLAIASGSFGLVSCGDNGKKPEPTPPTPSEQAIEFINDRTFSLMAAPLFRKNGTSPAEYYYLYTVYGTGWVIDDYTPNTNNDYWYYLATNWHVTRGFDLLEKTSVLGYTYITTDYFFADQSLSTNKDNIIDFYDYIYFNQQPSENNYIQCDEPVTKYIFPDSPSGVAGIDFHVCEVNFVNAPNTIKNKLDKLNSYRKEKGYINQFVNSDDESVINQTKYIGGYPYKENSSVDGGKWETHSIDASALSYNAPDDEQESHFIDDDYVTFPYYDCSAQYITDLDFGTDWMTGGASGSMLLTEDLKICGIYWGGHVDDKDNPTWFKPRFSLLKTSNYDFISQWTK